MGQDLEVIRVAGRLWRDTTQRQETLRNTVSCRKLPDVKWNSNTVRYPSTKSWEIWNTDSPDDVFEASVDAFQAVRGN